MGGTNARWAINLKNLELTRNLAALEKKSRKYRKISPKWEKSGNFRIYFQYKQNKKENSGIIIIKKKKHNKKNHSKSHIIIFKTLNLIKQSATS